VQSADVVFVTDQAIFRLFLRGIQSIDVDNHILTRRDRIAYAPSQINQKGKRKSFCIRSPQASPNGTDERERSCDIPFGASEVGGTIVTAFTYPEPGLKVLSCSNGAEGLGFFHKIAVASRDAESIRSSVGDASARTCSVGRSEIGQRVVKLCKE
jgi:hypothetical protein